jgi:hypothetical protein
MVSCINGAHFYATTAETSTKGCNAGFVLNGNTCNSTTATFKFQQYIWRGSMSYQIYETINPLNYNVYDEYRLPGDLQRRSDWYAYEVRVGGYCTLYSRSNEIYQLY